MKRIVCLVALSCAGVFAGVPVKWSVDAYRVKPLVYEAYHGETLDLEATVSAYGKAVDLAGKTAMLYWQTNGMGSAWWSTNATVAANGSSTNILSATLHGSVDTGAASVRGFIGVPGEIYRAEFNVKFRSSPGFEPNVLPLPTVSYDARLNGTPTINGTNLTAWVQQVSIEETDPIAPSIVSNVVTKSFVESLGIQTGGSDSNAVKITDGVATNLTVNGLSLLSTYGSFGSATLSFEGADNYYSEWSVSTGWMPGGSYKLRQDGSLQTIAFVSDFSGYVGTNDFASVSNTVKAWETYWDGDDVRVTVTNYDSSVNLPSLYLEQNTNEVTGASNVYRTVWSEMTRWNAFLPAYATFTNNVVQNYADRAWGVYDSSTGAYSPDGLVQISQQQIQIASGLAYQKTITTGGNAIWVLAATEPMTYNGQTNGFFRIEDGDGNALVEIVKGDKRTVGATATAITTTGNGMTITYPVNTQPTLSICTNLMNAVWLDETECSAIASVTWAQSSTNYVATVTPVATQPMMFAKASYEAGGETYVRHSCPVGLTNLYINGTNFAVRVETMNGKKVLVLQ